MSGLRCNFGLKKWSTIVWKLPRKYHFCKDTHFPLFLKHCGVWGKNLENSPMIFCTFRLPDEADDNRWAFFFLSLIYYEMTQHSHEISRSFVLCLRFISRTISANTSLTFVRCLALASTKEQPHIWAKACKKFNSVCCHFNKIDFMCSNTHHALNSWNFTLML